MSNQNGMETTTCFNTAFVDVQRLHASTRQITDSNNIENGVSFTSLLSLNLTDSALAGDQAQLKKLIRTTSWPKDHLFRSNLWKSIVQIVNKKNSKSSASLGNNLDQDEYNSNLDHILGKERFIKVNLPHFSRSNANTTHNYYFLNEQGKDAINRILCVFEYKYPDITFCPGIVSIASLLLHYMREHEVARILCILYSTKDHLMLTRINWNSSCSVFKKLMQKHFKNDMDSLTRHAEVNEVHTVFHEWYFWIFDSLPFDYLIRIMDCYLYEGQKVFYRIGLTITHLFCKRLKAFKMPVKKESIKQFAADANNLKPVDDLLKACFNIRNLTRSFIDKQYEKENQRNSVDFKPTAQIANSGPAPPHDSYANSSKIFLKETSTSILSHLNLSIIWNWLPARFTPYNPKPLFSTDQDGTSMKTLFNVLDELQYCLIILKTFENEIIGAFCSCEWNERKNKKSYFGNGETFLFTLEPEKKIHRWVGTRKPDTQVNQEMFVRVSPERISIGGGNCIGLSINASLTNGSSGRCDTFENEPLAKGNDFEIANLEIIGFDEDA